MAEPQRYVVDASVATKWYLDDEEFETQADAVLREFQRGSIQMLAPVHLRYEVTSAIRNSLRTKRLSAEQVNSRVGDFLAWDIPVVDSKEMILAGLGQALRFGCSLYDGMYLALAEAAQCPLIYADERLRNTLSDRFPLALWIADYPTRA